MKPINILLIKLRDLLLWRGCILINFFSAVPLLAWRDGTVRMDLKFNCFEDYKTRFLSIISSCSETSY